MIELKNITKSYQTGGFSQTALNKIDAAFRSNEFVAILGPSGSGKSTCLNIIGGLDRYDSGDLLINGRSTKEFTAQEWDAYRNNSIGFIFQSYHLIPHLSVLNNVELGLRLSGISAKERQAKAIEVLTKVGLKEHLHKKPNQLSGGERQRVAIARALVNDPDIILADEPTGVLDSKTSIQIMELIKEIAHEKLVIMVTHNAELATKYASRIIEFSDGCIVSDSHPYQVEQHQQTDQLRMTKMNYFTALNLSGKNMITKKWRTGLTAFACSVGIVGIALILALSNGFKQQINQFESNTLAGFPIMISQRTMEIDLDSLMKHNQTKTSTKKQQSSLTAGLIYPYEPSKNNKVHRNIITDEYLDFLAQIDSSLLAGIGYVRPINFNILKLDQGQINIINSATINFTAYPTKSNPNAEGYLEQNFPLLAGKYPEEITDLVLIVDGFNRLDASILQILGQKTLEAGIDYQQLLGQQLKLLFNDDFYIKQGEYFSIDSSQERLKDLYHSAEGITLTIVGILRGQEDPNLATIPPGISYSDQVAQLYIENAYQSEIVQAQLEKDYNILTGEPFQQTSTASTHFTNFVSNVPTGPTTKENMLNLLGANRKPAMIQLYPVNFTAKAQILEFLDSWNHDKEPDQSIHYTDLAATVANLTSGIMNGITLVLITFASISLVVSFIMIGIITYVSVLERTQEIGILRALGARRRDILRVFNAETFIIGASSGLLGIALAYLLIRPINSMLEDLTELTNVAQLNPFHALTLVLLSVTLTMLGGIIPAKIAADQDPVKALNNPA